MYRRYRRIVVKKETLALSNYTIHWKFNINKMLFCIYYFIFWKDDERMINHHDSNVTFFFNVYPDIYLYVYIRAIIDWFICLLKYT